MPNIILNFSINGKSHSILADPRARMLDIIRNDLGLTGTKEGCGVGECGACTIILNGEPITSCLVLAGQMQDAEILTIEGMSDDEIGRVIQDCFVEGDAVQCGFCTPGFVLSAYALLKKNPHATRQEIREAIAGNICRCTGYIPIVNTIEKAARQLAK